MLGRQEAKDNQEQLDNPHPTQQVVQAEIVVLVNRVLMVQGEQPASAATQAIQALLVVLVIELLQAEAEAEAEAQVHLPIQVKLVLMG